MKRWVVMGLLVGVLAVPAGAHMRHQVYVSGAAVPTTSATAVDVTGLTWAAYANIPVWFRCKLPVTTSVSTSRVRFDINGPAHTAFRMEHESVTTYAPTVLLRDIVVAVATLSAAGDQLTTVSVATLEGVLRPSAAGTYQVRFASETAGQTSTVEIGAWCEYSYER